MLIVRKGCLFPADDIAEEALRTRGYKLNDKVSAVLRKPRNPKFHRLAHVFGKMLVENLEPFENLNSHEALKKIQIEAQIKCKEILIRETRTRPQLYTGKVTEMVDVAYLIPKSLSFESMDEAEFREVYRAMAEHISKFYWTDLTPQQVEEMTGVMPT